MKEVTTELTKIEDSAQEFLLVLARAPNTFYLDFFKEVNAYIT